MDAIIFSAISVQRMFWLSHISDKSISYRHRKLTLKILLNRLFYTEQWDRFILSAKSGEVSGTNVTLKAKFIEKWKKNGGGGGIVFSDGMALPNFKAWQE